MFDALRKKLAHWGQKLSEATDFSGAAAMPAYLEAVRQKTGLAVQGDRYVGVFQGYPAWCRMQHLPDDGGPLYWSSATGAGDTGYTLHRAKYGGKLLARCDFAVEPAGARWPGSLLRELASPALGRHAGPQPRQGVAPRVATGVAWMDQRYEATSHDSRFLQHCCASQELQQHLGAWPWLNLGWLEGAVSLELLVPALDFGARFPGAEPGDIELRGLSLVAAAARAAGA